MEQKDKTKSLSIVMHGVTFNGPMFDIHDNAVVNNNLTVAPPKEERLAPSEKEIKDKILILLQEVDEEGNRIFVEQAQWYAVYKVLSQKEYGYPSSMNEFSKTMKNMGMDAITPKCDYESMRRVPREITQAPNRVTLWPGYLNKATDKFKKQIIVAKRLMELLEQ